MRGWLWTAALGLTVAAAIAAPGVAQDRAASGSGRFTGRWTADCRSGWKGDAGPRVQLSLRSADGDEHLGFGVRTAALEGLSPAASDGAVSNVTFRLVREAGAFTFRGSFGDGRGSGDYTFEPDTRYAAAMAGLGYRDLPRERHMRLAVLDVTTAFAREMRGVGFTTAGEDAFVKMRIHGVSARLVTDARADGYEVRDADDAVDLAIHGTRFPRRR